MLVRVLSTNSQLSTNGQRENKLFQGGSVVYTMTPPPLGYVLSFNACLV